MLFNHASLCYSLLFLTYFELYLVTFMAGGIFPTKYLCQKMKNTPSVQLQ